MSDVSLWKTVHVISAAILFGTGLGTAFFCWFGYRLAMQRAQIGILRAMLKLTVVADALFIAPAVLLQAATGLELLRLHGWSLASHWSLAAWGLFIFVGACWLPVVVIQTRLWRASDKASLTADLPKQFHGLFRVWFCLGVPAFMAMIAIFYLMVAKPLPVG